MAKARQGHDHGHGHDHECLLLVRNTIPLLEYLVTVLDRLEFMLTGFDAGASERQGFATPRVQAQRRTTFSRSGLKIARRLRFLTRQSSSVAESRIAAYAAAQRLTALRGFMLSYEAIRNFSRFPGKARCVTVDQDAQNLTQSTTVKLQIPFQERLRGVTEERRR